MAVDTEQNVRRDWPQSDVPRQGAPQLRMSSAVLVGLECRLESGSLLAASDAVPAHHITQYNTYSITQTVYISLTIKAQCVHLCRVTGHTVWSYPIWQVTTRSPEMELYSELYSS